MGAVWPSALPSSGRKRQKDSLTPAENNDDNTITLFNIIVRRVVLYRTAGIYCIVQSHVLAKLYLELTHVCQ